MDIKMMHEMVEKLTECAKSEMDKKGIEEIDTEEFGKVTDIIKDLSEAMYYRTLTEAMKEAEYGEDYDYMGAYDEHERKGYRVQPRDSKGRYMSRRGRRMGYEEPIYMNDMYPMEHYRDMDRIDGRMYYTSGSMGTNSMGSQGGNRGYSDGSRDMREGRSGQSRRGYMEAKEQGKDKIEKMKSLEDYMKSMAEDLTEAIENASPEERSMAKNKLSVLVQKM